MVELDLLWQCPRIRPINGKPVRIPYGVDIPPDLIAPIELWIRSSGLVYASKRLKSMKVWAIQILAGNKDYKEPWFTVTHYKGFCIPKLALFRYLLDNLHNLKIVSRILIILNSYKLTMVGEPSLSSINETERTPDPDEYIKHLRRFVDLPHVPVNMLEEVQAIDTRAKYCDDLGQTHDGPMGQFENDYLRFLYANPEPTILGRLVPIPDKGKWRIILVGHSQIQLRTKLLSDWLRNWLWSLPEVASGDQSKMSDFCITSLENDRYMLSIDLSEATDRLSRQLQMQLLYSMGVPRGWLSFLNLPCVYRDKDFGGTSDELKTTYYSNGQPMGLYISFPMFELAHYVILKWVTAPYKASFSLCGDDVVIACDEKDSKIIFQRYTELISRFGGKISSQKTLKSRRACEGVGALFLKGIQKEIRIPSGKLSPLEATTPGTWLNHEVIRMSPVGRAVLFAWLSTKLEKNYSYQQRRSANESLVLKDLSFWSLEAIQSLSKPDTMPRTYSIFEEALFNFQRETVGKETDRPLKWIGIEKYRDALVSNKIIALYKEDIPNG